MVRTISGFACIACILTTSVHADDWPQWLGENRDSVWRETGVVRQFPESGLPVKWRAKMSSGYAGPAVADGRVFVMDFVSDSGDPTGDPGGSFEGTERVLCFDAETGEPLWRHTYDCSYAISYPSGPRCTPTVDGSRVYALGAEGNLSCLDASTGDVVWEKDFKTEYGAKPPRWGVAAHPLVDGDRLYCIVGGEGSVAVCFDKHTGEEIWRSMNAVEQGYCPPIMIEHGGRRILVIWHPEAVNGLDPATGEVFWSVPLRPKFRMSIAAPRKLGDYLFASGIEHTGVMLKLVSAAGGKPETEIVWRGKPKMGIYSCNTTPFLQDGVMYGCNASSGALVGARIEDGERLWETGEPTTGDRRGRHGTAFLIKNGDRFFLFNEQGDLIVAKLSPDGYEEISRFHVLEPTNSAMGRSVVWSHPAFAQRCLFARNDEELVCVDLAERD